MDGLDMSALFGDSAYRRLIGILEARKSSFWRRYVGLGFMFARVSSYTVYCSAISAAMFSS